VTKKAIEAPRFVLPGIEDITRRDFLVGGAAALLLGSCGSSGRNEAYGETRTVETPAGAVEVPVNPRRVVPGYTTDADVALVLDLPLVGAPGATGFASQEFATYHRERLEGVEKVTTSPEPNLEEIAALRPDLILDSYPYEGFEDRYESFSRIVPTLNVGGAWSKGWKPYLTAVAGVFEREDLAEDFIAGYDERVPGLRERLAGRWEGARFALVGSYEPGTVYLEAAGSQPGVILSEDLGIAPSSGIPESPSDEGNISLERLDTIEDADIILLRVDPAQKGEGRDRAFLDEALASPLWQRLPAVRAGNVFEYNAELYYNSPLTARAFLDYVERTLLG
jgi:iron complex transport system substrate-binding protein